MHVAGALRLPHSRLQLPYATTLGKHILQMDYLLAANLAKELRGRRSCAESDGHAESSAGTNNQHLEDA